MFGFLSRSPLWQTLSISDWVSKYVIILGLFVLSVVCIAIIIFKYFSLKFEKRQMSLIINRIKKITTLNDLLLVSKEFRGCYGSIFLSNGLKKLELILKNSSQVDGHKPSSLSTSDIEHLEMLLNQELDSILFEQEKYLPFLGTSSAVSPLVGLFGTIWGLINSFISIGQERSADISTVSPGIAAALLTTLMGLVVAIPAMIAFHYFSNELRKIETQLNDIADSFLFLIKQSFTNRS